MRRYHNEPDNAFWGWNQAWLDPAFRDWRIDDYVPTIRIPVLLLQGAEDEYGTLAQFEAFQSAAYCPVEPKVIAGAGHAPHLTHKDETLPVIAAFVRRLLTMDQVRSPFMQNTA
jgi:pimeloyl-ACP methyl ester carboxylesterase